MTNNLLQSRGQPKKVRFVLHRYIQNNLCHTDMFKVITNVTMTTQLTYCLTWLFPHQALNVCLDWRGMVIMWRTHVLSWFHVLNSSVLGTYTRLHSATNVQYSLSIMVVMVWQTALWSIGHWMFCNESMIYMVVSGALVGWTGHITSVLYLWLHQYFTCDYISTLPVITLVLYMWLHQYFSCDYISTLPVTTSVLYLWLHQYITCDYISTLPVTTLVLYLWLH